MPVPLAPYPTPPAPYTMPPPPQPNGAQSQLICSGCRNLLLYPVGATSVCCAVCNAVTLVPPPGTEMAQLVCGGCHTLLMYIRGATSVQCSCCHTVNLAMEGLLCLFRGKIEQVAMFYGQGAFALAREQQLKWLFHTREMVFSLIGSWEGCLITKIQIMGSEGLSQYGQQYVGQENAHTLLVSGVQSVSLYQPSPVPYTSNYQVLHSHHFQYIEQATTERNGACS